MADGYASPIGTCVVRFDRIPPCPPGLAALVAVRGAPDAPVDQTVRAKLWALLAGGDGGEGATADREVVSLEFDVAKKVWRAELGSAAQARQAVAALDRPGVLPAVLGDEPRAFLWYNARAYGERGWCVLEKSVSEELLARLAFEQRVAAQLQSLPPKVVAIAGEVPEAVAFETVAEGAGPHIEGVRAALADETKTQFTGRGDRAQVLWLYNDFVVNVGNAVNDASRGEYMRAAPSPSPCKPSP